MSIRRKPRLETNGSGEKSKTLHQRSIFTQFLRPNCTNVFPTYQFYLRRGKVDGYDLDDWLMAEREVLNRFTDIRLELGEPTNGEQI